MSCMGVVIPHLQNSSSKHGMVTKGQCPMANGRNFHHSASNSLLLRPLLQHICDGRQMCNTSASVWIACLVAWFQRYKQPIIVRTAFHQWKDCTEYMDDLNGWILAGPVDTRPPRTNQASLDPRSLLLAAVHQLTEQLVIQCSAHVTQSINYLAFAGS